MGAVRIGLSLLIGTLAALSGYCLRAIYGMGGPGDFRQAIQPARDLLTGQDPFRWPISGWYVPSPLPIAILGVPLAGLPDTLAGAVFFGTSAALLAWYLLADRRYWRLLLFTSWPFLYCLAFFQFVPLIMLLAFSGVWLFVVLFKPQIALPLVLTRMPNWQGLALTAGLFAGSLLIYPTWPLVWLRQAVFSGAYAGFIPLLWLPLGPLILFVLRAWRLPSARLVALFAVMPQRMFYDQLLLFLVPETREEMLFLWAISWTGAVGWLLTGTDWQPWVVGSLYLPCTLMILRRASGALLVPPASSPQS